MSTDLDDLIRRDDDLYDHKGAADAEIRKRPTLAGALDALALGAPAGAPTAAQDPPHDEDGVIQEDVEPEPTPDQDPEAAREDAEDLAQEDDFPGDRPTSEAGAVGSSFAREVEAEAEAQRDETPEDRAYGAGWEAAAQKRPRAAPKDLKTSDEAAAWLRGYDAQKADAKGGKR